MRRKHVPDRLGKERFDVAPDQLLARVAEEILCLRIDQRDAALGVGQRQRFGRKFKQLLKASARGDQTFNQGADAAHVVRDGQHAGGLALFVTHQRAVKGDGDARAFGRRDLDLQVFQASAALTLHQLPWRGGHFAYAADGRQFLVEYRFFFALQQQRRSRISQYHAPGKVSQEKDFGGHGHTRLIYVVSLV